MRPNLKSLLNRYEKMTMSLNDRMVKPVMRLLNQWKHCPLVLIHPNALRGPAISTGFMDREELDTYLAAYDTYGHLYVRENGNWKFQETV